MSKLEIYKGGIPMTGGFTPKGVGNFPLMEAHDIVVDEEGTRLDDKLDNMIPTVYSLKPIEATSDNGVYYYATVPGVTELVVGLNLTIIPNLTSTTNITYLTVSGLGTYPLRRRSGMTTGVQTTGGHEAWLAKNIPISVMFTGTYWYVADMKQAVAADLVGSVPISRGGTSATTAAKALENLGAAAIKHTHTANEVGAELAVSACSGYDTSKGTIEKRLTDLGFKKGTATVYGYGAEVLVNSIYKQGNVVWGDLKINYKKMADGYYNSTVALDPIAKLSWEFTPKTAFHQTVVGGVVAKNSNGTLYRTEMGVAIMVDTQGRILLKDQLPYYDIEIHFGFRVTD